MNNGHYSRVNYRQNLPQHQDSGYNGPQSQRGWRGKGQQRQLGGMNPRHIQDRNQQTLLPGWVEATDPSSGKVYYCNPESRETKWERPIVSMTKETVLAPQQSETCLAAVGDLTSHHKAPRSKWQSQQQLQQRQQQKQQALPPGWVEAKDPKSEKIYYCNPQTRETTWERPTSTTSPSLTTTRLKIEGNTNSCKSRSDSTVHNAGADTDPDFETNGTYSGLNESMSSSTTTMEKIAEVNSSDNNDSHEVDNDQFDELQSLTTGQIAHLIKLQQHQQSAQQFTQSDEERQVPIFTIISSRSSKDSHEKNCRSSQDPSKYVPIDLSLMSSLSSTERTEPGRLDVRMYTLREELKQFGYGKSPTQPTHLFRE